MHIGLKSHVKKIFGVFSRFLATKMTDSFAWDQKMHIPFYYNARIYTRPPHPMISCFLFFTPLFGGRRCSLRCAYTHLSTHTHVHVHTHMRTICHLFILATPCHLAAPADERKLLSPCTFGAISFLSSFGQGCTPATPVPSEQTALPLIPEINFL